MSDRYVGIYARVSSADDEAATSIPDQLREARQYAAKKWPSMPVVEFSEIGSASSIAGRPEFCRLLAQVAEGSIAALVCRDQDRLSRETGEMLMLHKELTKHGVEVWLYRSNNQLRTDSPTDKAFVSMMATFSTFEREMAAVRTKARVNSMRTQGLWFGGKTPRGYRLETIDGKRTLVPSADAAAVKQVFTVAAETNSLATAFKLAKSLGLWNGKQGVLDALRHRIYLGEYRTPTGEWIKDHHEPIVDLALFAAAQKTKGLDYVTYPRKHDRVFIFEGLVRCTHCGNTMTNSHVKKKNGLRIFYYECMRTKSTCPVKRVPAGDFEEWIWERLAELCQDPKVIRNALDEYERNAGAVNATDRALMTTLEDGLKIQQTKQKTIKEYLDSFFREGRLPSMSWGEELVTIEQNIAVLQKQIAELKVKTNPTGKLSAEKFIAALRKMLSEWKEGAKQKQKIAQALVRQVLVSESGVDLQLIDPTTAWSPMASGSNGHQIWGG